MPFGPFISQEEKDRTNAALQQNYGKIEIPTTFDVAGVTYDMNTRQPVNQSQPKSNPRRSRYSSGNSGGAGQFNPSEVFSTPSVGDNNRGNRRGGGVKGRGAGITIEGLRPKPQSPQRTRYSSGVQEETAKPKPKPAESNSSSALPSLKPGDDIPASQYPAGVTAPSGRSETRTSPTGVVQTGTNTGYKPMTISQANEMLSDGYTIEDPFSSNQLPGTATNLYTKDPETVQFETGGIEGINTGASQQTLTRDLYNDGGAITFGEPSKDIPTYANIEGIQKEGGANLVQSGAEGKTDWLNRSMADNSDKNLARRRAFLDAESSLQGLRNAEATQGIVYAGGQHHMLNPNRDQEGQNDFVTIKEKDDVRGYKSGRLSAEDLKSKYVSGVTESMKSGEFPANTPNLDVQSEQPSAVTPVDTSTEQSFTVPENTKDTVSKLTKLKSNLFR